MSAPHATLPMLLLALLAGPSAAQCEVQHLFPADPALGDFFGQTVGVSGNLAFVGSEFDDDNGPNSGSAYVYERTASGWLQTAKLLPSDGAGGDRFGFSVDVDGDLFVGTARYDDDNGYGTGAFYVFERQGTSYVETKVQPMAPQASSLFGGSIATDGQRIVVGAPGQTHSGIMNAGAAFVFGKQGGTWVQEKRLLASDANTDDRFGDVVAIDGTIAVVGAFGNDDAGAASGSAYVFEQTGGNWVQTAKLVASDQQMDARFGVSVAVSGETVAVGALTDSGLGANTGAVYVFERAGTGWAEVRKLEAADPAPASMFGASCALDGDALAVGAWGLGSNAGAAYLFERQGGIWSQTDKLVPAASKVNLDFGVDVDLAGDALFCGARGDDTFAPSSGSAFLFSRAGVAGQALSSCPGVVSLSAGGAQQYELDAGPALGGSLFLVIGSASGTSPGLSGPPRIPLNFDAYMLYTIQYAGDLILGALGVLDPSGRESASLQLIAGMDPALAGVRLDHAYVVLDLPGTGQTLFASNAVPVTFVP